MYLYMYIYMYGQKKVARCKHVMVYLVKQQPESPFSFPSEFAQTVSPLASKQRDRRATAVAACTS